MKGAIVTGSSKGIGYATVKLLLEKGFKVVGWSRSKTEIEHENFHHLRVDVSTYMDVESAVKESDKILNGEIEILVNNAGFGKQEYLMESDPKNFDAMFATNVNGLYYCTRLIAPLMAKNKKGHIFNIASIAGTMGIESLSGYCASKWAVRGFSHSIFKELRKDGIKVSCINPGSVNTHFFDDFENIEADDSMMSPVDIAKSMWFAYETSDNFHVVEMEMRPLKR
ncbi:SDR family oxidoreductase [Luteibaculum oceani]|uniref:SDR family oxidoreductase n=1 Tax=Luteibaculum oceani TaxID=1294296 RepID=A0A5C6VE79_9FLAO|nr:SDR family oxidoreductase [Luteibaculum oceani]TXC81368.1 SDR family oxidoreductase [Luteibaculum oceani]